MTKTFDLEKAMRNGGKCVTREGRPARIIFSECKGRNPVIALIDHGSFERPVQYDASGTALISIHEGNEDNLFNIPEKKKGWIAHRQGRRKDCSPRDSTDVYPTKKDLLNYLSKLDDSNWVIQELEWEEV